MAYVPPKDRVLEHSTSNSQTVFTVTGAIDASFNAFSAHMAVGDTTIGFVVEPGVAFKSGILTYSATNQITIDSSTGESKGTFSSGGTKEVAIGLVAARFFDAVGTQTSDDAAAGRVGEFLTANGNVSLVSATAKTVVSRTLTPGDWDVSVWFAFAGSGGPIVTDLLGSFSLVDNTVDTADGKRIRLVGMTFSDPEVILTLAVGRVTVSAAAGTTTFYAVARSTFTANMSATAVISARRAPHPRQT